MMGNTNVVGAALGVGTAPRDVSGLPFLLLARLFSTPSTTRPVYGCANRPLHWKSGEALNTGSR